MPGLRRTVLAFPYWTSNPYLNVLYLASRSAGWNVLGITELDALRNAVEGELSEGDVVHIHWTGPVTDSNKRSDVRDRLKLFLSVLDSIAARRIQLLWTVHNEIAHDTPFYEVDRQVAEALARSSNIIIQLHEFTAEAVANSYRLPVEKLVTLRHSSYLGLHPDFTESEARKSLRVSRDAPTVGFVGRVRPYKGVETLFAAMDRAASRVDGLTLLLAGRTLPGDLEAVESSLPRNVDVVRRSTFVPDDELGLWLRASNVIVLPYQRILNSGSLLLAATYDRPCIVPDDSPLATVYRDEPWVQVFRTEGDHVSNLADVIVRMARGDGRAEDAARRFARSYTPFDMSRDYLRILDGIVPASTSHARPKGLRATRSAQR
jgi:beta-1,4-mannosyltransferase